MNIYFILALLSSAFGPLLYIFIKRHARFSRFIDGMTITTLVGLVVLHILPESLEHTGYMTFVAVILGLIGPLFLSSITKRKQCEIQKPFLFITILGFIAHNLLDGTALIVHPHTKGSTQLLALAVIIHRLLVSMSLYKTLRESIGNLLTILSLIGLALSMSLGYFGGEIILSHMEADILHFLQSLACGMLFHVILHPHHTSEIFSDIKALHKKVRLQSIGAFCGLILAILAYLFIPAHSHSVPHDKQSSKINAPHHRHH